MTVETLTIQTVADALSVSVGTVRQWAARREWPNGREMLGLKLSPSGAGDLRIFKFDFENYVRECAADFGPGSAAITAPTGDPLKLRRRLSKVDQRRRDAERATLDAMMR